MTQADVLLDRLVRSMQRGQVYQSIATILVVLVVMALAIWYVSEKSDRDRGIMLEKFRDLDAKVSDTRCMCKPLTHGMRSVGVTGRGLDGIGAGQ